MKNIFQIAQVLVLLVVLAQQTVQAQSTVGEENQAQRAKFEAALKSCGDKYGKPERGTPPSDEFKACMKEAGFDGPPRHPHGEGRRGEGPRGDNQRDVSSQSSSQQ